MGPDGGSLIAGYPHRLGGHCGSGSLRDLLEWAGLRYAAEPLGEASVFGLGGALAFTYVRGAGLGTPFYLVGRGPSLTEQLCARLGLGQEMRSTDDPAEGWRGFATSSMPDARCSAGPRWPSCPTCA